MKRQAGFRRVFSFLLALLTVLPLLPVGLLLSFADTEVYLTELSYGTVVTIPGELRIDSNITIGTESYDRGIYIHPTGVGDGGAASIEYNISGGNYGKFSVWVGKNSDGNNYGNNPMQFEIYVDDVRVAGSASLQYPDKEKLEAEIPEGARSLKLVAKAVGSSYFSCGAGFALPVLLKRDGGATDLYMEKSLTALEYASVKTLFGVTDPKTTQRKASCASTTTLPSGPVPLKKASICTPWQAKTTRISPMIFPAKALKPSAPTWERTKRATALTTGRFSLRSTWTAF